MNRPRPKRARSGCSAVGGFLFFLLAVGAIIGWPTYLDSHGASAFGVISEKRETVRIEFAEWFRRLEILATYSIPGQPLQHRAICDVDEKTYDSVHTGNTVIVHYFPSLLTQPFLPATHLSPCSTMASVSGNPSVLSHAIEAVVTLMAILFLWRVLRLRLAAWLLLPWLCLTFAYLGLPQVEPEPQQPVSATAIVDRVVTITTLGGMPEYRSVRLQRPYQIVLLKFLPSGLDTAVTAVDKVDADSVPNLQQGQSASIVYDAAHPRIAKLQQATRLFPGRAFTTVILCCFVFFVLIILVWVVGGFFRLLRRSARI